VEGYGKCGDGEKEGTFGGLVGKGRVKAANWVGRRKEAEHFGKGKVFFRDVWLDTHMACHSVQCKLNSTHIYNGFGWSGMCKGLAPLYKSDWIVNYLYVRKIEVRIFVSYSSQLLCLSAPAQLLETLCV